MVNLSMKHQMELSFSLGCCVQKLAGASFNAFTFAEIPVLLFRSYEPP
jgi:hypothetical protein